MVTEIRVERSQAEDREHILLRGISWETFEALVQELESQPSKRLTYDDGTLEIWMPLFTHESFKRWLGRLIEIVTEEMECEIRSLSASTWRRKDMRKGVEADECYYIQNEAVIRGKMNIDLTVDPPPDLAVEIDITSPSLPRLPIYRALGVPEVWRFDGSHLAFLILVEGEYKEVERSLALPLLQRADVMLLLEQTQNKGETSWARLVRRWIRERLAEEPRQ